MAFVIPEALKRAQNPMLRGILRSIATTDEMSSLIAIEPVDGTSIKLDREGTLPSTEFIADAGTTTEESTGTDDVPEVQFRRIVGNLDIDNLAAGTGGDSQAEKVNRLLGKKSKATWRLMKDKLINGGHTTGHTFGTLSGSVTGIAVAVDSMTYSAHLDSTRRGPGSIKYTHTGTFWSFRAPGDIAYGTPVAVAGDSTVTLKSHNPSFFITPTIDVSDATADDEASIYFTSTNDEFDGLWEMCDPSLITAVVGGNGDNFTLSLLDDLMDVQKVRESRAFIMPGKLVNQYYAAVRALGGADPQHVTVPGIGSQAPTYRGVPLLANDNISTYTVGSGTVSDMALVSLDPNEGLVLAAQSSGGPSQALSPDADPRIRSVMGFRIESLGPLEGKDANRTRVKWYGAPVLKSLLSCAVKQGVLHTNA